MSSITQGKTNWKFLIIVIILAIIVGAVTLWYTKRIEQLYQSTGMPNRENIIEKSVELNFNSLKNGQYYISDCANWVQLKDGCFEEQNYLCNGEEWYLYIKLYGFNIDYEGRKCVESYVEDIEGEIVAFGDLNGDGKKDAAVIINENTGGTGQIRILAIVINRNGKPYNIASQKLGDRVSINSININSEVVTVDFYPWQSKERMIMKFRLIEDQLRLEDIFLPSEKIISSQIAPNNIYAFITTQKSIPVQNTFKENENGANVLVMDNLIFVDLSTQEKREFDLYKLASKEIIDPLRTIPVPVQYTLYVNLLKWSVNSHDFWGTINLVSSADPPVNDSVSLFKINIKDWSIEKFTLPGHFISPLGQQSFNLERESVLFESATSDNELFLYLYEIQAKEKTTIVSYPNNIFSKYLPGKYGFLGYFYPQSLEIAETRQLYAKWLDKDTISYIDFVTRKEVIKKIE